MHLLAFGVLTFALVHVAWVFFRAKTFARAWQVLCGLFAANADAVPILPAIEIVTTSLIVAGVVAAHAFMRKRTLESVLAHVPAPVLATGWAMLAFAVVIEQGSGNAFIYFQF
jgi:alginate O-acetyltransferase complex protein AlgI